MVNFSPVPHDGYRLALPVAGARQEVINTDAAEYGGSGIGNLGSVHAEPTPWHDQPASAMLRFPPLGALWLAAPRALIARRNQAHRTRLTRVGSIAVVIAA